MYLPRICLPLLLLLLALPNVASGSDRDTTASDRFSFGGYISPFVLYNFNTPMGLHVGAQALVKIEDGISFGDKGLLDFEISAYLSARLAVRPFDSVAWVGNASAYRLSARYSTDNLEVRLGLQKINFGSASIFRPLMWFDQVDPRDPLKQTSGVWGALGRYYFRNNANAWLWLLYGNDQPKGMDLYGSSWSAPEVGGRFQYPLPIGEVGVAYHFRMAQLHTTPSDISSSSIVPEHRVGVDIKLDWVVGMWMEAAWIGLQEPSSPLANRAMLTIGTDYTIGVGNGLTATLEHSINHYSQKPFEVGVLSNMTALTLVYPIGIFDSVSYMFYLDWERGEVYNFATWTKRYDALELHVIAFYNPYHIAGAIVNSPMTLYGGGGVQAMVTYNF